MSFNPVYWAALLYQAGDVEKNPGPAVNRQTRPAARAREKMRIRRSQELPSQRQDRLMKEKAAAANRRSREASTERDERLNKAKLASGNRRSREASTERNDRLKKAKLASGNRRIREASTERNERLMKDKAAAANRRSREASTERNDRLKKAKLASGNRRCREASTERNDRLKKAKLASGNRRIREASTERNERFMKDKAAAANRRSQEASTERNDRLKKAKLASGNRRCREASTERNDRLKKAKLASGNRRIREASTERNERFMKDKAAAANRRSREASTERNDRLKKAKLASGNRRFQELPSQHEDRLMKDVKRHLSQREHQTFEKRLIRTTVAARRIAEKRKLELLEQRVQRLETDKIDKSVGRIVQSVVQKEIDAMSRRSLSSSKKTISRTASTASSFADESEIDGVKTQFGDAAAVYYGSLTSLVMKECCHCREKCFDKKVTKGCCARCHRDRNDTKKFSAANNMDPLDVPCELQGLTQIEELLIAQVRPIMSVYRLPYGQLGYAGNIINFPCDVKKFATTLPPKLSEVDIIVVRKKGANGLYKDLKVRRDKVHAALLWLKTNNPYYDDIIINEVSLASLPQDDFISLDDINTIEEDDSDNNAHMRRETIMTEQSLGRLPQDRLISEQSLGRLPQDRLISEQSLGRLPQDRLISQDDTNAIEQNDTYDNANMPHDTTDADSIMDVQSTFVPMQVNTKTEERYAISGLDMTCCGKPLIFPDIEKESPINEFATEGYIARAFPTLFPYGQGDFKGSRLFDVTALEYFRHLMRYHDQRFARHPRFRYFALNSILRWKALSIGHAFIRQNPGDKDISLQDLRKMSVKEKETLAKSILRIGYSLPGTRAFWQSRKTELIAFIEQIGTLPTIFFTLSAADLHWPELHRLMPEYASKSQAVVENPLICVSFFHEKVNLLLKSILPQMGLDNYWGRFEYQHRGSIHFHGLAWLIDAPDVSKLQEGTNEDASAVIEYFDNLVTAWNPILNNGGSLSSYKVSPKPTQVPLSQVTDIDKDYHDLLMTCQRHTNCSIDTCLRRRGDVVACRFDYPKSTELLSRIELEADDGGDLECKLIQRRNDARLNVHNRQLLQIHRANIDVQPIVSKKRVISYLTKYVSKAEVTSKGLKTVCNSLLNTLSPLNSTTKLAQRLLMRTVGDRDYSAQETVNILMDLPLVLHSRHIVHLSLRGDRRLMVDEDTDSISVPSEVERYFNRPAELTNVNLLEYTKRYYRNAKGIIVSRQRNAIVVVHPNLRAQPDSPLFEQFCKYYLLQHKPARSMENLKGNHNTYQQAYYNAFIAVFPDNGTLLQTDEGLLNEVEEKNGTPSDQDTEPWPANSRVQEDWMLLCTDVVTSEIQRLSDDVDWSESYRQNSDYIAAKDFCECRDTAVFQDVGIEKVSTSVLNVMQQRIYDHVITHSIKPDANETPLRMIVTGTAGTGKSYLIKCLKAMLKDSCAVMAPTGVAALAIDGCTVHSLLKITVGNVLVPLTGEHLRELQQLLLPVQYFILDEMSMVGQTLFGKVDIRLREAFPDKADCLFGGKSFILIGDFGQLPPVCDTPLYSAKPAASGARTRGALSYVSFTSSGALKEVVRQKSDVRFTNILLRLRDGCLTQQDYKELSLRFQGRAKNENTFASAVRLYPTVQKVVEYNTEEILKLKKPIATIEAFHNCTQAANASTDAAGGLAKKVMMAVDAKIMLTANIWIKAGLCNGSQGTVVDIVYASDKPPALPLFILCRFDTYKGPLFLGKPNCFPVFPIERRFEFNGVSCLRKNVPLVLAWGVTVHKAQGLTLPSCCVDLGDKEFTIGLSFVALSRVRNINDLLMAPCPFDRFQKFATSKSLQARITEDLRLQRISDAIFLSSESKQRTPGMTRNIASVVCKKLPSCSPRTAHVSSPFLPHTSSSLSINLTNESSYMHEPAEETLQYCQLSHMDCSRISQIMDLRIPLTRIDATARRTISFTAHPTQTMPIRGDGNCFYRAISAAVFGTQTRYAKIKMMVANVLRQFGENVPPCMTGLSIEDVTKDGEFATDAAIFATASAIQTPIAIFSPYGGPQDSQWRWMVHRPIAEDDTEEPMSNTGCIYLHHINRNHFNLVLDVQ